MWWVWFEQGLDKKISVMLGHLQTIKIKIVALNSQTFSSEKLSMKLIHKMSGYTYIWAISDNNFWLAN